MTQELSTKQEPTYMQIAVSGVKYNCEFKEFPLTSLKLDPDNGRLRHLSKQHNQDEVFEILSTEKETKKLRDSIVQVGGLMETPFVKELPEDDDFEAMIREGNRRKVSYELILAAIDAGKLHLDRSKFETMKVWVYPNEMPEAHQQLHVANMHISGKKTWAKLDQAAFITALRVDPNITDDDIVKGLQISKSTLYKQAEAYDKTIAYGTKYASTDDGWKEKYSHFERLFSQRVLKDWYSDPKNIDLYMQWIVSGRIPYAHKVAQIKIILLDPKMLKRFTESGPGYKLEDALIDATKNQKIKDSAKEISRKCDQAVEDLNDFLPDLPTHKLEDLVGSKLLNKYVECISRLQKYVDTVNATKKR